MKILIIGCNLFYGNEHFQDHMRLLKLVFMIILPLIKFCEKTCLFLINILHLIYNFFYIKAQKIFDKK